MSDAPLPTGQALAARLFELGLAPPDCEEVAVYGTPRYWYRLDGSLWQPWHRIEHCWYLVERCELSIESWPRRQKPDGTFLAAGWNVYNGCDTGAFVPTFAEVPTAICQVTLQLYAEARIPQKGDSHA